MGNLTRAFGLGVSFVLCTVMQTPAAETNPEQSQAIQVSSSQNLIAVNEPGNNGQQEPEAPQYLRPPFAITDVTVFKDGHALVMMQGDVELKDGWCVTRQVPVPILGTFWAFAKDEDAQVKAIKAGLLDIEVPQTCLSLDDLIQANIGRRVSLVEQPANGDPQTYVGELAGILKSEDTNDEGNKTEALASFVLLRNNSGGVTAIKRENLRSVQITDDRPATVYQRKKQVRTIALNVERDGQPVQGTEGLGMVYLQKGLRWIPSYRVELLDDRQARLTLQGDIVNDLADLDSVNLNLVVGVPNFLMKDSLSPLALRDAGYSLGYFFQSAPGGAARFNASNYLSNQVNSPVSDTGTGEIPVFQGESRNEDLFLYHWQNCSLNKGERMAIILQKIEVPYEDLYTWDISALPPQSIVRDFSPMPPNDQENAPIASKPMHKIRLTNTGENPWTTGPAAVMKEDTMLGQQLLRYTSAGGQADVELTVATDLNASYEDREVSREPIQLNHVPYMKVVLQSTLHVRNYKPEPVHTIVTRRLLGEATSASAGGKISLVREEDGQTIPMGSHIWQKFSENALSKIVWDRTIAAGETAVLECEWTLLIRM